jgi:hypothetical protein
MLLPPWLPWFDSAAGSRSGERTHSSRRQVNRGEPGPSYAAGVRGRDNRSLAGTRTGRRVPGSRAGCRILP